MSEVPLYGPWMDPPKVIMPKSSPEAGPSRVPYSYGPASGQGRARFWIPGPLGIQPRAGFLESLRSSYTELVVFPDGPALRLRACLGTRTGPPRDGGRGPCLGTRTGPPRGGARPLRLSPRGGDPGGGGRQYRGTSLIRNHPPLGPYSRPMPRVVGGGSFL